MRTGPTLALAGACATLFGASFLAADVMGKDEKASAPAPLVQKPKVQQVEAPEGRALSLGARGRAARTPQAAQAQAQA